jgi:hypothetical protein
MSKFKLTFAVGLPIVQLFLALTFLRIGNSARLPRGWDTAYTPPITFVCLGISAPASPLIYLAHLLPTAWSSASVMSLGMPQILFLFGVVVVWYITGEAIDHRRISSIWAATTVGNVLVNVVMFGLGAILTIGGIAAIRQGIQPQPYKDAMGYYVGGILFLIWSCVLVLRPLLALGGAIRSRVGSGARS